mmetsp:Transcript_76335/g.125986  ORF Transcript_76335/g.125986 Transcript_76335/m.125986 type:complete len:121 (-) Transcript_76335:1203-1565(-)
MALSGLIKSRRRKRVDGAHWQFAVRRSDRLGAAPVWYHLVNCLCPSGYRAAQLRFDHCIRKVANDWMHSIDSLATCVSRDSRLSGCTSLLLVRHFLIHSNTILALFCRKARLDSMLAFEL